MRLSEARAYMRERRATYPYCTVTTGRNPHPVAVEQQFPGMNFCRVPVGILNRVYWLFENGDDQRAFWRAHTPRIIEQGANNH